MSKKSKTLVLKKAYFQDGFNGSLEQIVGGIMLKLPLHDDRVYHADLLKSYRLAHVYTPIANTPGTFIRITSSAQGPTGIINLKKSSSTIDVEEFAPPANSEFVEDELMLWVANDHIVGCNIGNREGLMQNMLRELAIKANVIMPDFKFRITDIANKTEIEKIQQIGVKSVDLSISGYLANFEQIPNLGALAQPPFFTKLFSIPDSSKSLRKRANTTGMLHLSRGKFAKEELHKDEWLTDIASAIVEEDIGEYTIILEDGSRVSNLSLKVVKNVQIKTHANSICPQQTQAELKSFYDDLTNKGALGW